MSKDSINKYTANKKNLQIKKIIKQIKRNYKKYKANQKKEI